MTEAREITGTRATVAIAEVPGGWAWHCRTCNARAGVGTGKRRPGGETFADPKPFVDGEINNVLRTGEEWAERSATMHANERCAGAKTKAWRPPAYHPEEE